MSVVMMMSVMVMMVMRVIVVMVRHVVVMMPSWVNNVRLSVELSRTVPIGTSVSVRDVTNWADGTNWEGVN